MPHQSHAYQQVRRRLTAALATALLVGVLGAVSPASWSVTTDQSSSSQQVLCRGFAACKQAGMPHAGYKGAMDQMWWDMYSGVNCTNYVAYRMVRAGGSATRPAELRPGKGNATYWGTSFGSITNGSPAVGAIAWWRANTPGAGSAGHVAYVEQVVSPTEIVVSESNYGSEFDWRRIRSDGPWPSGFIHYRDAAVANTAAPTLSGTAQVGQTLTASPGSWKPAPSYVGYQWVANGVAIPGATGPTFTPGPEFLGRQVGVYVGAALQWYANGGAMSAPTPPVVPGDMHVEAPPVITGTAQVDKTLSVDPGAYSPAPDGVAVQWLADGMPIPGATGTTFVAAKEQAGMRLSVAVTAAKAGYNTLATASAPTDPVLAPDIAIVTPGRITGDQLVGAVLTADPGVLDPADSIATYVWQREGRSMPAFTGSSYVVKPRDIGRRITVAVTLSHEGYLPRTDVLGPVGNVVAPASLEIKVANGRPRSALVKVVVTSPDDSAPSGRVWIKVGRKKVAVDLAKGVGKARINGLKAGDRPVAVYYPGSDRVTTARATATVTIIEPHKKHKKPKEKSKKPKSGR